jgi:hypothetical protein
MQCSLLLGSYSFSTQIFASNNMNIVVDRSLQDSSHKDWIDSLPICGRHKSRTIIIMYLCM